MLSGLVRIWTSLPSISVVALFFPGFGAKETSIEGHVVVLKEVSEILFADAIIAAGQAVGM